MEAELIKLCAHPSPDHAVSQISTQSIDWEALVTQARYNEIVPLVYSRLAEFGVNVPTQELERLRAEANAIVGWNLKLAGEMVSLLTEFREAGINVVPFKGPPLVCALYGGLKLRECRDLDLFVDRPRLEDAVDLLNARGYKLDRKSSEILHSASTFGMCKDLVLSHTETHLDIELHWAACEPDFDKALSATNFWSDTTTITVLGELVPLPKPEDLLVLLVIHGSRHYWNKLKLLADIAMLLTVYKDLNLELARQKLGTSNTRMLLIPLAFAHNFWNVDLPPWVLVLLKSEPAVRGEVAAILERLFDVSSDSLAIARKKAAVLVSRESLYLSSSEVQNDRRRLAFKVLKRVFLPNQLDQGFNKIPIRFRPFLYLVRPFRIVRTYGLGFCLDSARMIWRSVTVSRKK